MATRRVSKKVHVNNPAFNSGMNMPTHRRYRTCSAQLKMQSGSSWSIAACHGCCMRNNNARLLSGGAIPAKALYAMAKNRLQKMESFRDSNPEGSKESCGTQTSLSCEKHERVCAMDLQ